MWTSSILVTLVGLLVPFSTAGYVLQDDYSADQFFSMFDFFTVRTLAPSPFLCQS
jgi:NADH:ubiquinone oxidoreductase subunit 5 (subunit L)/multisubunit Na+/H+ antiporter MnhA subunit